MSCKHNWMNMLETIAYDGPADLDCNDYWCIECGEVVSTPDGVHPGLLGYLATDDYKKRLSELGFTPAQILEMPLPTGRMVWSDD